MPRTGFYPRFAIRRVPVGLLAVLSTLTALSHRAAAEAPSREQNQTAAESLFLEGRKLMADNKLEEACQRFADSRRLDPAIGTTMNLARCYLKLGRSATAWQLYRETAATARSLGQPDREQHALDEVAAIEPDLAKIVVELAPALLDDPRIEVLLDGTRMPVGSEVPVDPGPHQLVVRTPRTQLWTTSIRGIPRQSQHVRVPQLEVPADAPAPAMKPTESAVAPVNAGNPAADRARNTSRGLGARRIAALAFAGAAALGAGFTIFETAQSASYNNRSDPTTCVRGASCSQAAITNRNKAFDSAERADLAAGVSGVCLVGAGVLWSWARPSPRRSRCKAPAPGGSSAIRAPGKSAMKAELPEVGALIGGKYRIEGIIGSGGMGVVFRARHLALREQVAIKVLKPDRGGSPQLVERLLREARAAASIRNGHVVGVLDVGTLPDGQPFIVMEHLQGEDLASRLSRTGPLPVRAAIDYLLETCEAVAEAHALGIVHRDLKPANLFLQRRASGAVTVKVLDFGVARFLSGYAEGTEQDSGLTSTHSFVGSPAYVSPEQLTTPEDVDTRADIWALGVILYELLTGAQPFKSPTLALTCTKILQLPLPAPARDDLAPELLVSLERALEKDREQRFATVLELSRALAPHGSATSQAALAEIEAITAREAPAPRPSVVARASEPGFATLTGSVLMLGRRAVPNAQARRLLLLALGASALVGGVLYWRAPSSSPPLGVVDPPRPSAPSRETLASAAQPDAVRAPANGAPGIAAGSASALATSTLPNAAASSPNRARPSPRAPAPLPANAAPPPPASAPIPAPLAPHQSFPADKPSANQSERLYEFRQ